MFKEGILVQALPQFVQVEKVALYAFMLPLHRNIAYENVQRNIRWENKKKETESLVYSFRVCLRTLNCNIPFCCLLHFMEMIH